MLRDLPAPHDPRVLAGPSLADDAGIYRLTDDLALIQTVDFFTPIVDDPYTYGQIAAANALSDVYAMGGVPSTALNIAVYPTKTLPMGVLSEVLRGGADKAREADVAVIGGHTVDGVEPMYGLAVTGTINPEKIVRASGAKAGDVLVLTKPLGTGAIATALKAGAADAAHLAEAVRWMSRLNREASVAMLGAAVHASTDVTGFGLLGHLSELARASSLAAAVEYDSVPLLPGALDYADRGFIPGGGLTNREYLVESVAFAGRVLEPARALLFDPQTSGGLLMAVDPDSVDSLTEELCGHGDLAAVVGVLHRGKPGAISVT